MRASTEPTYTPARTARSLMEKLRGESLPWGTTITVQRRSAINTILGYGKPVC